MRIRIAAIVTLCLFAGATAFAQEEIEGAGTPGYVPVFTGYKIGNSNIFESNGNIGIGSTFPPVPLYVYSTSPVGPAGYSPSRCGLSRLPKTLVLFGLSQVLQSEGSP